MTNWVNLKEVTSPNVLFLYSENATEHMSAEVSEINKAWLKLC